MGFVTLESADQVTVRDISSKESILKVSDIQKREKVEQSMMPAGLVATLTLSDFAGMLDYLQELAKPK
jgi:hypothetical protein